jgi:hypothetical protein
MSAVNESASSAPPVEDYGTDLVMTWVLDTDTEAGRKITLPLRTGYSYAFTIDWGDGTSSTVNSNTDTNRIHLYASTGIYTTRISGVLGAWQFNNAGDRLKLRSVLNWGNTSLSVFGLDGAFYGCTNAVFYADFPTNFAHLTTLVHTFRGNSSLTALPDLSNLRAVTTISGAFRELSSCTYFAPVNHLTNLVNMQSAWHMSGQPVDSMPDVSNLTRVNNILSAWRQTSARVYPEVNTLTNVTSLETTWYGTRRAEYYPEISNLWRVTSLNQTYSGGSTNYINMPSPVGLTNLAAGNALRDSYRDTYFTNQIDMTSQANFTNWNQTFYLARMSVFPLMPTSSVHFQTFQNTFQAPAGFGAFGSTVELWDTNAFPNLATFTTFVYRNQTNLSNYADIPAGWK